MTLPAEPETTVSDATVRITPERGLELSTAQRLRTSLPLLRVWTRRELRARYRQSALRASWSLIQPITILVTYGIVLTRVLDVSSPDVPYLTLAWSGIVPFTFVQQSLGQGVGSLQQAGPLLSRVYFPREVLPLAVVGGAAADLAIMTVVLLGVVVVQVGPPTITIVALIPAYLMLGCWTAGVTMAAAALTVFRRDLNHAMPLVLRVLFIVTPVMYPADLLGRWIVLNPIAVAIGATRDATYGHTWPDPLVLGIHLALGFAVLVGGYRLLARLEPQMGDWV